MHWKMPSTEVVCCIYLLTLLTNVCEEANSVAPTGAVWVYTDQEASKAFEQTKKSRPVKRNTLMKKEFFVTQADKQFYNSH